MLVGFFVFTQGEDTGCRCVCVCVCVCDYEIRLVDSEARNEANQGPGTAFKQNLRRRATKA